MDLYAIDKLMEETRQLAARYRQATGSVLPVTAEIARFDAARALELRLNDDPSQPYDATGSGEHEDLRFIIKGRAVFDPARSGQRIGQLNTRQDWDYALLVMFDADYLPEEIYQAHREDIEEALESRQSKQKKRGAMSVAQFKIIGTRVWSMENGREDAIWDNRGPA